MQTVLKPIGMWMAIACLAMAASSCTKDPGTPEPGEPAVPGGRAVLSTSVVVQEVATTRAGEGESSGLAAEGRIVSARIMLFEPAASYWDPALLAGLADYTDIAYTPGTGWSWQLDTSTFRIPDETVGFGFGITGNEAVPEISFYWNNIPVKRYYLAVLINPQGNQPGEMLDYFSPRGESRSFLELLEDEQEAYKAITNEYPMRLFSQDTRDEYLNTKRYSYAADFNNHICNALCGGIPNPFVNLSPVATAADNSTLADLDGLKILMSNADGIIEVGAADFHESIDRAQQNPVTINVDRAVAKVAVFNETGMTRQQLPNWEGVADDFYILPNGDRIWGDIYWSADVVNMYTTLIRTPVETAPNTPGHEYNQHETPRTPRKYRYAKPFPDTYLEGGYGPSLSWQYMTQMDRYDLTDLLGNSYYYPPESYFLTRHFTTENPAAYGRVLNDMPASSPQDEWVTWQYVTENALSTNFQYGDVSTSAALVAYYIPDEANFIVNSQLPLDHRIAGGEDQVIVPGDEAKGSYYMFNGTAIAKNVLEHLYDLYFGNNGLPQTDIPVTRFPLLKGLDRAFDMIRAEYTKWYEWKNTSAPTVTDAASVFGGWFCDKEIGYLWSYTQAGLNYYPKALHCYPIPIPHFDSSLSPEYMGYGRYGIVRNNVYKLSVKAINGPGKPAYRPWDGPNDTSFGNNIQVNFFVEGWNTVPLRYEL